MVVPDVIFLAAAVVAGLADPEYTTCHLAKRITVNDVKICLYVHANKGQHVHYPTHSFTECPKRWTCRYHPNKQKGNTLKDTMDSLKEQFE